MLYILEEAHTSRGSGTYFLVIEAENEKEAEKLANEYIKQDTRVLSFPLFRVKMIAHESLCPVVINKDNFEEVLKKNRYKK